MENNMIDKLLKLESELLNLKKEKIASDELNELYASLAKAQGEFNCAPLNKANPYFKSKYADLASIISASREALFKNNLCITQIINNDTLLTRLGHSSGQWIESRMKISPQKQDIQSLGSYLTYCRRYAYAAIAGIYAGDDDDGESAMQRKITKDQLDTLLSKIDGDRMLLSNLLKVTKLNDLADLETERYDGCLNWISKQKENNHENN